MQLDAVGDWQSAPARDEVPVALADLHRALRVGAPVELTFFGGEVEGRRVFPDDDLPGRWFAEHNANSDAEREKLTGLVKKLHGSAEWRESLKKNGWDDAFLTGEKFGDFLDAQDKRVVSVLKELGL